VITPAPDIWNRLSGKRIYGAYMQEMPESVGRMVESKFEALMHGQNGGVRQFAIECH
jgi:hypothetical protein